jgi:isopropylmalate/homocitrate/citramalate synthase
MTIQTQIQQAISSAKSVEASLTQFGLETQNQQAKQLFQQLAQQQKNITTQIEGRYQQVLQEEPQFQQNQ